jgi:hypothetical protein
LLISPDGTRVLFDAINKNTESRSVIIYTTQASEKTILEIEELTKAKGIRVNWSQQGSNLIILSPDQTIFIDSKLKIKPIKTDQTIQDVQVGENFIWLLTKKLENLNLNKLSIDDLETLETEETVMNLPIENYHFVTGNDQLLWLTSEDAKSGLVINTVEKTTTQLPKINNLRWESNNNGRILLWNDFEIFIINPDDSSTPELITRLGTPIKNTAWHPKGSYILFSTENGITAIELDGRDHRNIFRIVEFNSVNSSVINTKTDTLYFVGSVGNQDGIYERPL